MVSKETTTLLNGHLVFCTDLDSRTQFYVHVFVNANRPESEIMDRAKSLAQKHELVEMLSGNTFEFEYIQPSGNVVEIVKTIKELSPISEDSKKLLETHILE